jgi:hypothetical protein
MFIFAPILAKFPTDIWQLPAIGVGGTRITRDAVILHPASAPYCHGQRSTTRENTSSRTCCKHGLSPGKSTPEVTLSDTDLSYAAGHCAALIIVKLYIYLKNAIHLGDVCWLLGLIVIRCLMPLVHICRNWPYVWVLSASQETYLLTIIVSK